MVRTLLLSAVFMSACGTPTAQEVTNAPPPDNAPYEKCVTDCTHANQMRAVDAASILADCRKSCTTKGKTLPQGKTTP